MNFFVKIRLTNEHLLYNHFVPSSFGYSFATLWTLWPCFIMDSVKSYLLPYFYILPNILFTIDYSVCFLKIYPWLLLCFIISIYIYTRNMQKDIFLVILQSFMQSYVDCMQGDKYPYKHLVLCIFYFASYTALLCNKHNFPVNKLENQIKVRDNVIGYNKKWYFLWSSGNVNSY